MTRNEALELIAYECNRLGIDTECCMVRFGADAVVTVHAPTATYEQVLDLYGSLTPRMPLAVTLNVTSVQPHGDELKHAQRLPGIYRLTCGAPTPETTRKVAEAFDTIDARARRLAADEVTAAEEFYSIMFGWRTGDVTVNSHACNSDTCHGCDDCGPAHEPKGDPVYGGVCRHCGSRDDYPEQGKDGKVCCWQCFDKHGGE